MDISLFDSLKTSGISEELGGPSKLKFTGPMRESGIMSRRNIGAADFPVYIHGNSKNRNPLIAVKSRVGGPT